MASATPNSNPDHTSGPVQGPGNPSKVPVPYKGPNETPTEFVNRVLSLVNEIHAEAGLPALESDESLRKATQTRATECAKIFSHTRPDGRSYKTALSDLGLTYGAVGENLATGHTTPEQVLKTWPNSEGHRANLLNKNYTKLGIGLEKHTGNRYRGYCWSQLFM